MEELFAPVAEIYSRSPTLSQKLGEKCRGEARKPNTYCGAGFFTKDFYKSINVRT